MHEKIIPSPKELLNRIELTITERDSVQRSRTVIQNILQGSDPRTLCIVGPCSIHMSESGLEYAKRLKELSLKVQDSIYIVLRAYLEKPRTIDGWRGFLFDPDLDGSYDIFKGLELSRQFLKNIVAMDLPIAYEFVEPTTKYYIQDLVSWGCIGARTCQSPIHRQLASTLSFPVGFKNTTSGDILAAIHGAKVSCTPQHVVETDINGQLVVRKSRGNPLPHIVLRGGKSGPNYQTDTVLKTISHLEELKLNSSIIIDCAHDNSGHKPSRQLQVAHEVISTIKEIPSVKGFMLESFLMTGKQDDYKGTDQYLNASINASKIDSCLGWKETEELLIHASTILRRKS